VAAVRDLPVRVLDTRKTASGLRLLDKYAVAAGGGHNHRLDLGAMVLRAVAETGVDAISVGALTHSAPAMDLSMLLSIGRS
jgi:nicotinate-nucleotide pyrophosphorylase